MVHEEFKEMIPTYVLSALDGEENRALSDHLSQCAECQRELENWQATAATLSLGAQPLEPSPAVHDRIMKAIREESLQNDAESKAKANVIKFKPANTVSGRNYSSVWAIAAAVLFLITAATLFLFWQESRANNQIIAELSRELQNQRSELDRSRNFFKVMMSPGARMDELAGTNQVPEASAKLAHDKTGHAMLMANGLPPAPTGKEYQLWFIVGKKTMPGKSFSVDSSGKGMLEDQIPESARDAAIFAITLEPAGGVDVPTGAIYLRSGL
ncbi:MAG TPA: anti-sigma factor [Pyrinomonadaceae bacterium]|nr:anti-sigma factor [Pyrinomonadaceae bacterium]